MIVVDAMFWVVCLVLVVAGASKVSAPQLVAPTFASLLAGGRADGGGGRDGRLAGDGAFAVGIARTVGVAEVLIGIVALTVGGPIAAMVVAFIYVAFAVVVVMARRRGLASCGCFGVRSAAPSWVHVAVNLVSGAIAVVAALAGGGLTGGGITGGGPASVADGLADIGGVLAVVVVIAVVVATAMVVVLDTTVADAVESGRRSSPQHSDTARSTSGGR